eukprot:3732768-Prymnesium_polylepis.1
MGRGADAPRPTEAYTVLTGVARNVLTREPCAPPWDGVRNHARSMGRGADAPRPTEALHGPHGRVRRGT